MHWKEIVPSNQYSTYMNEPLSPREIEVLTLLYQPLIGSTAMSLYLTLSISLNIPKERKATQTHKFLMLQTGLNLDVIFTERKKLEGIGLVSVYREKNDDGYIFHYYLHKPMSAKEFFEDEMMSVFLYNKIGSKIRYRSLRQHFTVEPIEQENLEEITVPFDKVFISMHPSELKGKSDEMIDVLSSHSLVSSSNRDNTYDISEESFDYEMFINELPHFISKKEFEDKEIIQLVKQLAFIYKLSPATMALVTQDALIHKDKIELDELRMQAKRHYLMTEKDQPPRLGLRLQPPELSSLKKEPETDFEKLIHYFDTTAPIEFMEELTDGAKVYEGDIDTIERLIFEYKLNPGVVNVLLDYIFKVNNQKLSKAFAFKIANHWKRKKISTVKEAMDIAKQENSESKKFAEKGKGASSWKSTGAVKNEPLPKWMTEKSAEPKVNEPPDEKELQRAKGEAQKYKALLEKRRTMKK